MELTLTLPDEVAAGVTDFAERHGISVGDAVAIGLWQRLASEEAEVLATELGSSPYEPTPAHLEAMRVRARAIRVKVWDHAGGGSKP